MPKILCTIPGAPDEIGGMSGPVKFAVTEDGLVADCSDADAEHFCAVPGYKLLDAKTPATPEQKADAAERDALLARAAALEPPLAVDNRWKMPRLKSEVEHAEKVAAEAIK